ncbi:MAG TPA: NAD(P)-dependent oxidoreductase [Pirellulales bacterium]|jgi:nucleoside-diphosphate-sugar epimerase|nr:NAD(P)-dependent oxidoreductase [Pirellulales bacterium]
MARVLVTGATGFIGSQLAQRLVAGGDDVTCLVRRTSKIEPLQRLGVRFALGDVRDGNAMQAAVAGTDVVYHLAGLATAFHTEELIEVNAHAFRNVVGACARRETPPTLISVSSLAAAGPSHGRPRVEGDPAEPVSHYGRTKRAAELIAHEFASQVPITIVRPPIVFGEGDQQMRGVFRSVFRLGVHLALGVAHLRYSLIHVRDLLEALVMCATRGSRLAPVKDESRAPQGYYFASADEQPTFAELGMLIGASLGRARVRICRSSGSELLWAAAAVAEVLARLRGQPYIFNFDKAREAQAGSWICSNQTIRQLGFAPAAALLDRLRQTSDWYRQQNWI